MLTETNAPRDPSEDKARLIAQISHHVKRAERLIDQNKAYRAFFHIAAGQHILESSDAGRYIGSIPAKLLMMEDIALVDLMAELAAKLSLMCGVIPCGYDAEEQLNQAIELWQRLFQKTGDTKYREKRAGLIAQQLARPLELLQTKELMGYFDNAKALELYDLLENDDDEILITIPKGIQLKGEEKEPTLYYDGGEHGILFKNDTSLAICDYIHAGARANLFQLPRVLIFELYEPVTEYMAEVVAAPASGALIQEIVRRAAGRP